MCVNIRDDAHPLHLKPPNHIARISLATVGSEKYTHSQNPVRLRGFYPFRTLFCVTVRLQKLPKLRKG